MTGTCEVHLLDLDGQSLHNFQEIFQSLRDHQSSIYQVVPQLREASERIGEGREAVFRAKVK